MSRTRRSSFSLSFNIKNNDHNTDIDLSLSRQQRSYTCFSLNTHDSKASGKTLFSSSLISRSRRAKHGASMFDCANPKAQLPRQSHSLIICPYVSNMRIDRHSSTSLFNPNPRERERGRGREAPDLPTYKRDLELQLHRYCLSSLRLSPSIFDRHTMRLTAVLFLCWTLVVVHGATTKKAIRRNVTTTTSTGRGTTKAPDAKSAYAYLRSVRGKNSCAGGSCPFWERHARSFASLRCYSQQYQECTCLHRMCFSSCMFSRDVCNMEMVGCLRQICTRCMPASASSMCSVYDSMAERVAQALSAFACYPCCPNGAGGGAGNSSSNARVGEEC